jgi:hypothetical protein
LGGNIPSVPTEIIYAYYNLMAKQVRPLEPPPDAHGQIRADVFEEKQPEVKVARIIRSERNHRPISSFPPPSGRL